MFNKFKYLVIVFYIGCNANEISEIDKSSIQSILDENQKIHEYLFKNDTGIPSIENLQKVVSLVKSENKDLAVKYSELKQNLQNINFKTRKDFIIGYSVFSENLAGILKKYKLTGTYHHFYCPMEEKSWVSKGIKIENPYAPEMRDCGEIIQKY